MNKIQLEYLELHPEFEYEKMEKDNVIVWDNIKECYKVILPDGTIQLDSLINHMRTYGYGWDD